MTPGQKKCLVHLSSQPRTDRHAIYMMPSQPKRFEMSVSLQNRENPKTEFFDVGLIGKTTFFETKNEYYLWQDQDRGPQKHVSRRLET